MSDQDSLADASHIEQRRYPVGEHFDATQRRSAGQAVCRQVRDQDGAADCGETARNLLPRVAVMGGTVQQQERRSGRAIRVEVPAARRQAAAVPDDG